MELCRQTDASLKRLLHRARHLRRWIDRGKRRAGGGFTWHSQRSPGRYNSLPCRSAAPLRIARFRCYAESSSPAHQTFYRSGQADEIAQRRRGETRKTLMLTTRSHGAARPGGARGSEGPPRQGAWYPVLIRGLRGKVCNSRTALSRLNYHRHISGLWTSCLKSSSNTR